MDAGRALARRGARAQDAERAAEQRDVKRVGAGRGGQAGKGKAGRARAEGGQEVVRRLDPVGAGQRDAVKSQGELRRVAVPKQVPEIDGAAIRGEDDAGGAAAGRVEEGVGGGVGESAGGCDKGGRRPCTGGRLDGRVAGEHLVLTRRGQPGQGGLMAKLKGVERAGVVGVVFPGHQRGEGRCGLGRAIAVVQNLVREHVAGGEGRAGSVCDGQAEVCAEQARVALRGRQTGAERHAVSIGDVGGYGRSGGDRAQGGAVITEGEAAGGVRWQAGGGEGQGLAGKHRRGVSGEGERDWRACDRHLKGVAGEAAGAAGEARREGMGAASQGCDAERRTARRAQRYGGEGYTTIQKHDRAGPERAAYGEVQHAARGEIGRVCLEVQDGLAD